MWIELEREEPSEIKEQICKLLLIIQQGFELLHKDLLGIYLYAELSSVVYFKTLSVKSWQWQ